MGSSSRSNSRRRRRLNKLQTEDARRGPREAHDEPLAVVLKPGDEVLVRPKDHDDGDDVEADLEELVALVGPALIDKPLDKEDVLEVLELDEELGVEVKRRDALAGEILDGVPHAGGELGKEVKFLLSKAPFYRNQIKKKSTFVLLQIGIRGLELGSIKLTGWHLCFHPHSVGGRFPKSHPE